MNDHQAPRGNSNSQMREAVCKDCLREELAKERAAQLGLPVADLPEDFDKEFRYNEQAARTKLERGQTRSDRCKRHRGQHQINIQGMAVPYIDLQTIGEANGVHDPEGPRGPFGGLGPMPPAHKMAVPSPVDLGKFGFGMDEGHIHEILNHLANPQTRICVVKAGTGTGKSTYMPYRLLDPPENAAIRLADLGPIIVTEPRVQATTGVADFVGSKMSGAGGVGPGYPVGFQVSGQRAHDDSCQLIYVTDGTMINWLREGRLTTIGTVIVDEAHERSTNIDFIMGFLKKAIDRHPHLRVIITSATFDERFYQEYFGGPGKVAVVDVPALKTIGYGFPLFPELDAAASEGTDLRQAWTDVVGPELPLRETLEPGDRAFVTTHFQKLAPPLKESEVAKGHEAFIGWPENLFETTTKLLPLRYQGPTVPAHQWKEKMPKILGDYIVQLVRGLDEADVFGDILGFLPTGKSIDEAVAIIKDGLGIGEKPAPSDPATVYALLSSLDADLKELALTAQGKGDKRKIVISTNLAETSLTVEGVRFVVDSGLIAQSEWDPAMAQGGIPTKAHSQAGIRQRWGRVGRKAPGWVFPLYTKTQFLDLAQDTPPGSARSNLEQLIMTAKLGGIDDVVGFDWPAKFLPPADSGVVLDESALKARDVFLAELERAAEALRTSGAVDTSGDPTSFGKELSRSPGLGSTASAISIMHADRLACVPEVVTILKLLDNTPMVGAKGLLLDGQDWPDEWRLEASERHRALATGCQDDAELALQVMAVWERAAPGVPPWKPSAEREQWARRWWINHDALLDCAEVRRTVLEGLSPAMKEEVKRFVEPALVKRARGAITRSMSSLEYRLGPDGIYRAAVAQGDMVATGVLGNSGMTSTAPERIIPLKRTKLENREHAFLSNLVRLEDWALPPATSGGEAVTSAESAMQFLVHASRSARPETTRDTLSQLQHVWPAGLRVQLQFGPADGELFVVAALASIEPAAQPAVDTVVDEVENGVADATPEDASPELDTSWPTPVPMETDPDMEAWRAVIDIEEYERDLVACLDCVACLRGDLEDCEEPLVPVEAARATNELAAWRERASRNLDVSKPRVIADGPVGSGQWYEVTGYDVTGLAPAIRIRPDWRTPGSAWAPAVHPGFEPGQLIEVEVGPDLSDHRGQLRAFTHRASGNRFVLREATHKPEKQEEFNKLAISLHRRTAGLLSQLKPGTTLHAHVIPLPERGCSTITLLGILAAHWQSRANRFERLDIVRADGSAGQGHFYRAIVHGEPQVERAVAAAAVRDSDRGLMHLFGLRLVDPESPEELVVPGGVAEGAGLFVQVRPEVARLAVGGIAAAALQSVLDRHPDMFYSPAPPQQPGQPPIESGDLSALSTLDTVPAGWLLGRRNPLPRRAAQDLAALDSSSESWVSRCWFFWARSHHLQTSQRDGFRLEPLTELTEVAADRHVLSTDDRGQLAGATVRARPPGYWRASFAKDGDRMAGLLGADAVFLDGDDLVVAFGDDHGAERGATVLRTALALPGAMVTVDGSAAGRIIGKSGANLRTVLGTPGVWIYSFDRVRSTVMIVAEPTALAVAVANVVKISSGTTARMIVPAGFGGRIIGRQGSMKNDLLARSGCTYANPIERGADEWKVQGPTPGAVTTFLGLAAGVVAGTTGEITESMSATVVDLVSAAIVTNYAINVWTHASLPEVTVATKARISGPE